MILYNIIFLLCMQFLMSKSIDNNYNNNNNFIIYGYQNEIDEQRLKSGLELSFDVYRSNLTVIMNQIDVVIKTMDNKINKSIVNKKITNKISEIHNEYKRSALQIPLLWNINEDFLRMIIKSSSIKFTYGILDKSYSTFKYFNKNDLNLNKISHNYENMDQLLIHLNRDWGDSGSNNRNNLYKNGIIKELQEIDKQDKLNFKYFYSNKIKNNNQRKKILVPGAGLGRLAIELAVLGFDIEANEYCGSFVGAMRTIISEILPDNYINSLSKESNNETRYKFYPHLNFPLNNDWDFEARLNPVLFPSSDSIEASKWAYNNKNGENSSNFVIQLGSFVDIYKGCENHQKFDIIITCFFIDTAVDIYDYIYTIINILKVGGIWINAGPLHYHSHLSIKYSYKQIIEILKELGFNLIKHSLIEGSYCGDESISMKPEYYSIPIDIFRLEQIDDDNDEINIEEEINNKNEKNVWRSTNFQVL